MREAWKRWCGKLPVLHGHLIPQAYFSREVLRSSMQLHGFGNPSESAYTGVVYLRAVDQDALVHISLIMAKTKVAPIKRLTMLRLELCVTVIIAKLLSHKAKILHILNKQVYAWSDSIHTVH